MARPPLTGLVALRGQVTDGEIFETTFGLANFDPLDASDLQNTADVLAGLFNTNLGNPLSNIMSADQAFTRLAVYDYSSGPGPAGMVAEAAISSQGQGPGMMPLQVAVVTTLRTARAGRSYRGRMYWPASGLALGAGHLIANATATSLVNALAAFFTAINANSTDNLGTPAVVSATAGAVTDVIAVTADQRPDIQRRRANSQPVGATASAQVGQ